MEFEFIEEVYHYKMVREIARGGMGAVYEAQLYGSEGFRKKVALKLILEKMLHEDELEEMFIGEAKLVANLIHPNITQVYQLGKIKDTYYIAMEFINGYNLEEFFLEHERRGEKVSVEMTCFIVSRVCRGLAYAHQKLDDNGVSMNIVHRDVSLKNIMITIEGEVKVTDFGIAKANHFFKDHEGEIIMGKAEYMSPEQAQYKKTDGRSDLFSLGIVFYELLTGINPFYDDDIQQTLKNVISNEPPPPSKYNKNIPPEIDAIVLKSLKKDLSERYQNGQEMLFALEYYMYHDRYGPTCETLAEYLKKLFKAKEKPKAVEIAPIVDTGSSTATIRTRLKTDDIKRPE